MSAQVRASGRMPTAEEAERVPSWQEVVILQRLFDHANTHDIAESLFWYKPDPEERLFLPVMRAAGWVVEWMGTYTISVDVATAALARAREAGVIGS